MNVHDRSSPCPCGSGGPYAACCGRFVDDATAPPTALELMCSRYTAYVLGREDYLLRTWHASTRPEALHLADAPVKWLGLKVLGTRAGGVDDDDGQVEFVARYKVGGKATRLQETSRFVREGGNWYYLDGSIQA